MRAAQLDRCGPHRADLWPLTLSDSDLAVLDMCCDAQVTSIAFPCSNIPCGCVAAWMLKTEMAIHQPMWRARLCAQASLPVCCCQP